MLSKMAALEHDKLPEKGASVMQQMTFPKVRDRTREPTYLVIVYHELFTASHSSLRGGIVYSGMRG